MKSYELLKEVIEKHGAKTVAAQIGLSVPRIYQWAQPPEPLGSGATNPLDRIESLLSATQDNRLADWVCQRAGGVFVRDCSTPEERQQFLKEQSHALIENYAAMIALFSTTSVDGKITQEEATRIRSEWQRIKSTTELYVRQCEDGTFRGGESGTASTASTASPKQRVDLDKPRQRQRR